MDLVLVFPLIIAVLSTGQSYTEGTEQTSNSCYALCPAGYHKVAACDDPAAEHRCEKCANNTFTEIKNSALKCRRCDSCGHYEVEIRRCSFNSNVVCDCKERYYNAGSNRTGMLCSPCCCKNCKVPDNNPDYKRKCQPCQRKECLKDPECKMKSTATTISPSTNLPTTTSATTFGSEFMTSTATPTSTRTTASSSPDENPAPPNWTQMPWLILSGVIVAFLVLFWLLLFTRNLFRYPDSCPCWSVNKDPDLAVEDPKSNEQSSHQDSSPTTLTLNISEETPMMTLSQSPASPEHAAHSNPLLPDTEHKAARQEEQLEHWPAIVLYAIIKEVPLRRWKEFLRLLSVADQQLERVELEAGLGSMERQYQMLRLWSQRSSASLNDVFSALRYMDLSGCAQLLQESLDKLQ